MKEEKLEERRFLACIIYDISYVQHYVHSEPLYVKQTYVTHYFLAYLSVNYLHYEILAPKGVDDKNGPQKA